MGRRRKQQGMQHQDLNDLRQITLDQDRDSNFDDYQNSVVNVRDDRLFGLSAVERMLLSMALLAVTVVISTLLLLATESIAF